MSYSDIMKMQREAEDRAREMNSRASKSEEKKSSGFCEREFCGTQRAAADDDRLLILALLLILSKNSNDRMIMLALLYILM